MKSFMGTLLLYYSMMADIFLYYFLTKLWWRNLVFSYMMQASANENFSAMRSACLYRPTDTTIVCVVDRILTVFFNDRCAEHGIVLGGN